MSRVRFATAAAIAGLLTVAAWPLSASAYPVNLGGTYVPGPSEFGLAFYRFYAPFTSQIEAGRLAPIAEGYFWAEAWTAVEVGVGGGYSTSFVYPYDRVQAFSGGPERAGLAGFTVNLNRQLWAGGPYEGRLRLRTDVGATNAGAPQLNRLGLQHSQSLRLGDGWRAYANANVFLPLARPGRAAGSSLLPGRQLELNTALEYTLNRHLSVIVEQLGSWQATATEGGLTSPETGSTLIQLAPGITWMLTPQFALQASVALPVYWGGFQAAYPWTTTVGLALSL